MKKYAYFLEYDWDKITPYSLIKIAIGAKQGDRYFPKSLKRKKETTELSYDWWIAAAKRCEKIKGHFKQITRKEFLELKET